MTGPCVKRWISSCRERNRQNSNENTLKIISEKKKKKEWKELSGRKEGKDGYQFGDVTRSLWSRFTGGSSESDDEKEKEDDGKKEREEKDV